MHIDDEVYLDDEESRKEYVLNDTGIIYRGNANYGVKGIDPMQWNFGQVSVQENRFIVFSQ